MINELITLANHLDRIGANVAANNLDLIIRKSAGYSKARPETIQDFNANLAIVLRELSIPQSLVDFSPLTEIQISQANAEMTQDGTSKLLYSLTSVPNEWTNGTQAGWVEYSRLAGQPDAGVNPDNPTGESAWVPWAAENGYEPTLKGMFQFMGDTMDTVMPAAKTEEQEIERQDIGYSQTDDYQAQEDAMKGFGDMDAQMGRDKAEHQRIYDALVSEKDPFRQESMLSNPNNKKHYAKAVSVIEGIPLNSPKLEERLAYLATSAERQYQTNWDATQKRMSAEASNVINTLIKVADSLDRKGLRPEASTLDNVIKYLAR